MLEKIKMFFQKKEVKFVCAGLFVLSCTGLVIGGATTESVNGLVVAVVTVIAAVSALIVYIGTLLK